MRNPKLAHILVSYVLHIAHTFRVIRIIKFCNMVYGVHIAQLNIILG